jgi:hypothetical protein
MMTMTMTRLSLRRALACVLAGMLAVSLPLMATQAEAQQKRATMPEPYVSSALDAVLMPVTKSVVQQFKLPKTASGAVVVSVQPGGVGDTYGFEPGEVISTVAGKQIRRPVDVDTLTRYWMGEGDVYFWIDGTRKGRPKRTIVYLEPEDFQRSLPVQEIPRWRSYEAPWFNFYSWYQPYSYQIVEIYDYSVYYIEEVVVTDVYITSVQSEESYFYYDYTELTTVNLREDWVEEESELYCGDVSGYGCGLEEVGYPDPAEYDTCSGEPGDDWCLGAALDADYCSVNPEDAACLTDADYCSVNPGDPECGGDSDAADYCSEFPDDPACGDLSAEAVAEEQGYDDTAAAEGAYEDPAYDDSSAEAAGYDEPVTEEGTYDDYATDEQTSEEPVYEEQAYEEQAYEEQAYEEPAYEEQAYEEQAYEEPAYEEQAYEEPAYEEPAYEEPAYEEPAYEEPAAEDCVYDEDGNPLC